MLKKTARFSLYSMSGKHLTKVCSFTVLSLIYTDTEMYENSKCITASPTSESRENLNTVLLPLLTLLGIALYIPPLLHFQNVLTGQSV